MDNLIKTLFISIFFISCEKQDVSITEEASNLVIGSWQLKDYGVFSGDEGDEDNTWVEVSLNESYVLTLNENLKYTHTDGASCNVGTYSINEPTLFFNPESQDCATSQYGFALEETTFLVLLDQNNNCDEFCAYRFERVVEE